MLGCGDRRPTAAPVFTEGFTEAKRHIDPRWIRENRARDGEAHGQRWVSPKQAAKQVSIKKELDRSKTSICIGLSIGVK